MNEEYGFRNSLATSHHSPVRWRAFFLAMLSIAFVSVPTSANAVARARPSAPSVFVFDEGSGVVVKSERAEVVRPVASLTKLMTAMVLLDAGADLERTVAYDPKRHYAYKNWMRFTRGDQLRGRDLFLATLVGSQNIPARMLVDLTPYSEPEFVARMSEKVASLGLTQTRFVDVHGLSSKNVSTAPEIARLLDAALEYPDIADALGRSEATVAWRTRRGKVQERLFHHTNTLVAKWQRFATEASKTGYLDEAGDTIAMRIRDPRSGQRFTVVALGEARQYPRFRLAKRLAESVVGSPRIASSPSSSRPSPSSSRAKRGISYVFE